MFVKENPDRKKKKKKKKKLVAEARMFQWRSINADLSMLYLTIAKEQINTLKTEIAALKEFILEFSCGFWPYLLKKSFIKNFIFCAVPVKDLR